jgi:hypothetical protein
VNYANNINAGTGVAIVRGIGSHSGLSKIQFTITPAPLTFELSPASLTYNGNEQAPTPTVTLNGQTLTLGTDYELAYPYGNHLHAGTITTRIRSLKGLNFADKNNFTGDTSQTFRIEQAPLTITPDPGQGKTVNTPSPTIQYAASGFMPGDDESVIFGNPGWADCSGSVKAMPKSNYCNYGGVFQDGKGAFTGGCFLKPTAKCLEETNNSSYAVEVCPNYSASCETVGSYAFTTGNLTAANYRFVIAEDAPQFTITQAGGGDVIPPSITITQADITYPAAPDPQSSTANTTVTPIKVKLEYKTQNAADATYSATVPTNAGSYTVRATLTSESTQPAATADFTIVRAAVKDALDFTASKTYTGKSQNASVTLKEGYANCASDLSVLYNGTTTSPKDVDTYPLSVTASESTNCLAASNVPLGDFEITPQSLDAATVVLETESLPYTGSAQKPAIVAVSAGGNSMPATDCYVSVYSSNTNAGTASVKLTGLNNCSGSATQNFEISKVKLTVTPEPNQGQVAGVSVAKSTLKYSLSGFVNNEDKSVVTGAISWTDCDNGTGGGTYASAHSSYSFSANNTLWVKVTAENGTTVKYYKITVGGPHDAKIIGIFDYTDITTDDVESGESLASPLPVMQDIYTDKTMIALSDISVSPGATVAFID